VARPTTLSEIALRRLHNQQLSRQAFRRPQDLVAWMGAVQGQEFGPGTWAIGLRTQGATAALVERAVDQGKILRTWPMRGTIHFVASKDARWMLELLAPRVIRKFGLYYRREKIDDATFAKSRRILVDHLRGGQRIERTALYALWQKAGISTKGSRGLFILGRLAMEGVVCFGPKAGHQPTFTLLDEFAPDAPSMDRKESLRELGRRYFTSHGPATIHDLVWWTGMKVSEAKEAAELASDDLVCAQIGERTYWMPKELPEPSKAAGGTYLLPTYDEYLLGYKDRSAALDPSARPPTNLFTATIVHEGRVLGFWRRSTAKGMVQITTDLFRPPTKARQKQIDTAAQRYGDFFGLRVSMS
jgi:hypothetical protein